MSDIKKLHSIFKEIKARGWILSTRKGTGGVGHTFETLIGKCEDNFEIPDFGSIEIKTKCSNTDTPISLFTASPDGDIICPVEKLQQRYGYPDKDYPEYKVLNIEVKATEYTKLGNHKKFKLEIDRKNELVRLIVIYYGRVESYVSWSFYVLNKKIQSKLKYLAIVDADYRFINGIKYYKYNNITFYEFRSFKTFISLMENGIVSIKLKISIFKKGKRFGQRHDRGTSFSISIQDIDFLYRKLRGRDL